jgi:hypothetical protein
MAKVFISYRRKPSAMLATLIAKELEKRGIEVFVDTRKGDGAGSFPRHLLTAVENGDVFVCLLANTTFESDWVRREIEHAFTMGKTMIPVFQESYRPPPEIPETSIEMLLMSQGVHVLDEQNIYVDEAIYHLAVMIEQSVPGSQDVQVKTRPRLFNLRWLWLLIAAIILLGIIAFLWLNPPNIDTDFAGTQTAIALVGTVTDEPTATATSTLTPTAEPTATNRSTVIPTPELPFLVGNAVAFFVRTEPWGDSTLIGSVGNQNLHITGISGDDRYYRVWFNGQIGWVNKSSLGIARIEGDVSDLPIIPIMIVNRVDIFVRSEPSGDSAIIATLGNQRFVITCISADSQFYRVSLNGQSGWVSQAAVGIARIEGDISDVPTIGTPEC